MSSADELRLRDAQFLAGLAGGAETLSPRFAPVLFSTRKHLGEAFGAARELARLTRADVAALGTTEQRIADFESGSVPLTRGT